MLDLGAIKYQFQNILSAANTTTSTNYLSMGLSQRIQKILRVNPSRIPIQADWYPCVSVFIDEKSIELLDIVPKFSQSLRRSSLSVKIVGAVWNSIVIDAQSDPADDECEKLMENIENAFRNIDGYGGTQMPGQIVGGLIGSSTIGSSVIGAPTGWYVPSSVTYHNAIVDEGVNLRAGIMTIKTELYY